MKQLFLNAIIDFKIAYYISNLKLLLDSSYFISIIAPPEPCPDSLKSILKYYEDISDNPHVEYIKNPDDISDDFSTDIDKFLQYIQSKILTIFIPCQDETTYKLINEFCEALKNFYAFYLMLDAKLAKKFSTIYSQYKNTDLLCSKCQEELDKVKNNIIEMQKTDTTQDTKEFLYNLENHKMKLDLLLSFLSHHIEICSLFEKITDGKSLLIHTEY